jgi:hypothetical protein
MKMRTIALLTIFVLTSNTCRDDNKNCHDRIVFINTTNKTLYIVWDDTTILSKYNGNPYSNWNKALPNGENNTGLFNMSNGRSYCYENTLNDTLHIFIFEDNVLATYTWQEVVDNYMVLQRYDLNLTDLQQLNWQISYPPSEAMKDIKMYPPYGE